MERALVGLLILAVAVASLRVAAVVTAYRDFVAARDPDVPVRTRISARTAVRHAVALLLIAVCAVTADAWAVIDSVRLGVMATGMAGVLLILAADEVFDYADRRAIRRAPYLPRNGE